MPMAKRNFAAAALALLALFCAAARGAREAAPRGAKGGYSGGEVIAVRQGALRGLEKDGALYWRGVPYAAAPVGHLRWKAPRPAESWEGERAALETMSASQMGLRDGESALIGSEEGALTLDITRPATADEGLPILFYIHGGNSQTGDASFLDATRLSIEEGCVVVSINHRLGLQGFISLPALKTGTAEENSGNFGLLDIAAALDWVIENAAAFGGDARNITVAGSSAGGRNVMAMLISPLFAGKFQKAISFSGGMTVAPVAESQRAAAYALSSLVAEKGGDAQWLMQDNDEVRAFLYSLSDEELSSAFGPASIRMSAFPHLFADGVVLPSEGFETRRYNEVPILMVNGASEFSGFCKGSPPFDALSADELMADPKCLAQFRFAETYGSLMYGYFNGEESAERMLAAGYGAPIYTCTINWGKDPAVVGDEYAALFGSYHCMTTQLMTGDAPGSFYPELFLSEGFVRLGRMLNTYYGNFLRSGDPNGEGLPEWRSWTSLDGTTQLIADADKNEAFAEMSQEHTSYSEIIGMMERDRSIPEGQKEPMIRTVLNARWFSRALDEHYGNESLWR